MRSKAKKCLILAVMCATIAGGPLAPYVFGKYGNGMCRTGGRLYDF